MGLASIMVHVGADAGTQGRIAIACSLADRFHATVIAVAGQAPSAVGGDIAGDSDGGRTGGDIVGGDELAPPVASPILSWLAELERDFRKQAQVKAGVAFRAAPEQPTGLIIREARAADLVILGRAAVSDIVERAVDPARVLMHCGRPVLVVPDTLAALSADRVVVGWKETREARRAVRDALEPLKQAKEVTIAAVEEQGQAAVDTGPLDDVAAYLARHGVTVGAPVTRRCVGSIASTLASIAGEKGADLIVAGGYGRGHLSELMFGGVTHDLLGSSPVCCLLSH
jgi:nucleotide-binding universal stress UspA family protein